MRWSDNTLSNKAKNPPLVSVTIPTLERTEILRETLKMLHTQSYSNIEIVVSDSTQDHSVIEMIESDVWNVKLISHPEKKGAIESLNSALELCTGKYVMLLDDDSFPGYDSIKKSVELMESNDDVGLISFGILNYGIYFDEKKYRQFLPITDNEVSEVFGFSGCGGFVKRSTLNKYGRLQESEKENLHELHICAWVWNEGKSIVSRGDIFVYHHISEMGEPAKVRGAKDALFASAKSMGFFYMMYFNWRDMVTRLGLWYWALCNGAVEHRDVRYLKVIFDFATQIPSLLMKRHVLSKSATDKVRLPNHFRGV